LGNTDPSLLRAFITFLNRCYGVKQSALRIGLQVFNDIDIEKAVQYWSQQLGIERSQFCRPTISPSQSTGTYRKRSEYGVVTLYFNNTKLRNLLVNRIAELQDLY